MQRRPKILAACAKPAVILIATCAWLGPGGGCGFAPGHDYAVTTTWLLNGAVPDASRCKELGIEQFELRMEAAGAPIVLRAQCDETIRIGRDTYGGFVTTQSFDYGVVYHYTVDAIGPNGEVTHTYEADTSTEFGEPDPVDLALIDVFEPEGDYASYSAAWTFGSGETAAECVNSGFSKVELWIASATDLNFEDAFVLDEAKCEAGQLSSNEKVLARGNYLIRYVALDERDAVAEQGEPISVVVDEEGELALRHHQFKGL